MTQPAAPISLRIFVDADACPVKDEVYRVAGRFGLPVSVVANSPLRVPQSPDIERIVVGDHLDAADDWIAERAGPDAVVITADVPLAARCVANGAAVIAPNGRPFTKDSIGMAVAMRDLLTDLRSAGEATSGPPPFTPRDRSAFLSELDRTLRRLQRNRI
ncbi:MAG: YaiI/YqxD family protein [Methylacidiphilales bacterium]|nr:YaiI/YqxD family protein [Candidatus Methylacidiphilales bacterium]